MSETSIEPNSAVVTVGAEDAPQQSEDRLSSPWSVLNICFVVTSIIGCVAELWGNPYIAAGAMCFYLGYGCWYRDKASNFERFGDSIYYQGFILTLFALLVALIGKGNELTSSAIINRFGLAIITTFVGMSGRIVIIQFFTSAADFTDDTKKALADYIAELNREIGSTLQELRTLRKTLVNSAKQVTDELREEAQNARRADNSAVREATADLVAAVKSSTAKLNKSLSTVVEKIEAVEVPTEAVSGEIRRAADAIRTQLEGVRQTLADESGRFKSVLNDSVSVLERTRSSFSDMNDTIVLASTKTSETLSKTEVALNAASGASAAVNELAQSASVLADHLSVLSRSLDSKAEETSKRFMDKSSELDAAVKLTVDEARQMTSVLSSSARSLLEAVAEARQLDGNARQ